MAEQNMLKVCGAENRLQIQKDDSPEFFLRVLNSNLLKNNWLLHRSTNKEPRYIGLA
tara:strand:+ start:51 stop:221 length:171 start_codon:yes stop_codon:yes gene_type:complete